MAKNVTTSGTNGLMSGLIAALAVGLASPALAQAGTSRDAAALIRDGNALLVDGGTGEALERYREAVRLSTDLGDGELRAVAEHNEALALYRLGEFAQAEAIFRRLAATRANRAGASEALVARSTYNLGRTIAERVEREQVAQLDGLSPEARFGQVPVDEALAEYESEAARIVERLSDAGERFRTARSLDPKAEDAARNIELIGGRIAEINAMVEHQRELAEQLRELEQQQQQQDQQGDEHQNQDTEHQREDDHQQQDQQGEQSRQRQDNQHQGEQDSQGEQPQQPSPDGESSSSSADQPPQPGDQAQGTEPGEPTGDDRPEHQPSPGELDQLEQDGAEPQAMGEVPELVEGPESAEYGELMDEEQGNPLADLPPDLLALLQRILDQEAQNRERFHHGRAQRGDVERDW
ncbi:MAG: hypothetical protein AAGI30_05195 [Planctomycetota bacterium]